MSAAYDKGLYTNVSINAAAAGSLDSAVALAPVAVVEEEPAASTKVGKGSKGDSWKYTNLRMYLSVWQCWIICMHRLHPIWLFQADVRPGPISPAAQASIHDQPSTGSSPAEQPPSSLHYAPRTAHPGAACHVQTTTSTIYLIHIAAMPAILCRSITAARWEAITLLLAVPVRNGRG
jgi:hypothetical protein